MKSTAGNVQKEILEIFFVSSLFDTNKSKVLIQIRRNDKFHHLMQVIYHLALFSILWLRYLW